MVGTTVSETVRFRPLAMVVQIHLLPILFPIHNKPMTKIQLKAITVTYTRTLTVSPTTEMFEDWEYYPDQEGFESLVINQLFDKIHNEMGGPANPMPYTNVEQFETVEIDWEGDDEEDEE
jgi:hypothetical protein